MKSLNIGDFQFKEVKIGAKEIVKNLHHPDGRPIIPPGSLVYISTDDPTGVCLDCLVQRKSCDSYFPPKPVGCPEDPSWNAFIDFGWHLRFLHNYRESGKFLSNLNPNVAGMVEIIACSRAKIFAGTFYSTFTGFIHRLRGYHGLGDETYYHSNGKLMEAKLGAYNTGFTKEFKAGWTDDQFGEVI